MIIGCDLDNTIISFPDFFKVLSQCMHTCGHTIGIVTARPEGNEQEYSDTLKKLGIDVDFIVAKPDALKDISDGVFKGLVCLKVGIDVLFDDFENSNEKMVADFLSVNSRTIPFTSWGYQDKYGGLDKKNI